MENGPVLAKYQCTEGRKYPGYYCKETQARDNDNGLEL